MHAGEVLGALSGSWVGTNGLRMMPDDAYESSAATASVTLGAGGHVVSVAYGWEHEGRPQQGLLLVGADEAGGVQAVWADSWHQQPHWMPMRGELLHPGVQLSGEYDGGGWRIRLEPGETSWRMVMDNVMPETGAYPVVIADFSRTS